MKVVIEVLAAPAMLGETCHAWMALAIMADATEVPVSSARKSRSVASLLSPLPFTAR
jgi:hypothetical protein